LFSLVTPTAELSFRKRATRKVKSLVYIAAFAPDQGESVSSLIANPPAGAPVPPILPPVDGFLFLDREKFAASFAADVRPDLAGFKADSYVPWGLEALQGAVSQPAWRSKPNWYLVAKDDGMIPPPAQRMMAVRPRVRAVTASPRPWPSSLTWILWTPGSGAP
jgi:hypothetical protein